jgi:hypothetical protein
MNTLPAGFHLIKDGRAPQPGDDPGFYVTNPYGFDLASFDGRNFDLLKPYWFLSKDGSVICVRGSFRSRRILSDGASSPRLCWRVVAPFGKHWPAAELHDELYRYTQLPKDKCDGYFLEAMELTKVNAAARLTLYKAVCWFGQSSFDEDRKALCNPYKTFTT